jgi:hypothetical protein
LERIRKTIILTRKKLINIKKINKKITTIICVIVMRVSRAYGTRYRFFFNTLKKRIELRKKSSFRLITNRIKTTTIQKTTVTITQAM